jgi:hypothetical protein
MQLLCQRNSLNLRSFTVQEIAEPSEILTLQKNARALVSSPTELTQEGEGCVEMQEPIRGLGGCLLRRVHFELTLVYAEALDL